MWHVSWPDWHLPFHDEQATAVALKAVEMLRPQLHGITLMGDVVDVSAWSTHPRKSRQDRVAGHDVESSALTRGLGSVSKAAGRKAKKVVVMGNHEFRVERELMRLGRPDLIDLLDPSRVMEAAGYQVVPYAASPQQYVIWRTKRGRRVIACHGAFEGTWATRNHARAPCWRGDLVIHGHTHRPAHHVEIDPFGVRLEAISAGCLSDLNPPWLAPRPATGWGHGLGVLRLSYHSVDAYVCEIKNGAMVLPDG